MFKLKRAARPPEPPSLPDAPAPAAGAERRERSRHSTHGRVRTVIYVAFLALAAAALFQGWSTSALEQQRSSDAALLDRVGQLRTETQQLARRAALIIAQPGERSANLLELGASVEGASASVRIVEQLLADQLGETGGANETPLRTAFERWRSAHEKLRDRAAALVRAADGRNTTEPDEAVRAVQNEADPALAAAQALNDPVRGMVEQRALRVRMALWLQVGLTVALLLLLAVTLVEPMVRRLRRRLASMRKEIGQSRRLALVAEHTSALVMITDRQDRIRWVNPGFTRLAGWRLQEVRYAVPTEFLRHPQGDTDLMGTIRDAISTGKGMRIESLFRRQDGSDMWLDIDLRPLRNPAGVLKGFLYVATDISSRVSEQAKMRVLWLALPAGVVLQEAAKGVTDVNHAAEQMLGLTREQLLGQEPVDANWRFVREDRKPYPLQEQPTQRTLRTGKALRNEIVGVHTADGNLRWLTVNTEPQFDANGHVNAVICCYSDVTERRALQDQLTQAARTDGLTGLPNRTVVMERLQRAIQHAKTHSGYGFAVLFMDFDRFKHVNDTLGHGAGDALLKQIGARLRVTLRPGDEVAHVGARTDLAARLGGDEFVVVLDGVHEAGQIKMIADRLLLELAEPYNVLAHPVQCSASIGIVIYAGGSEQTADDLLRNADTAMYEAKRAGRGRWVLFDDSMHQRVVRALEMENDLRRSLKDGDLFVAYQPIVSLDGHKLTGVEALVRWRHPVRGLVPPSDFIPVAEECGLIGAIGQMVLTRACDQFMKWREELGANAPGVVAVNLSRGEMNRPTLVADVAQVLATHNMPASCLQLEVTESLAAQDERVQAVLRELKTLGVKLALDDFGTGYSSLACLHQLPVDTVKIDRSFVKHAETLDYHRVLIEATIRVTRALGMTTIAEGVETEGQAALMQRLSCDRAQGWLFAKPMPPEDLPRWLFQQVTVPVLN